LTVVVRRLGESPKYAGRLRSADLDRVPIPHFVVNYTQVWQNMICMLLTYLVFKIWLESLHRLGESPTDEGKDSCCLVPWP